MKIFNFDEFNENVDNKSNSFKFKFTQEEIPDYKYPISSYHTGIKKGKKYFVNDILICRVERYHQFYSHPKGHPYEPSLKSVASTEWNYEGLKKLFKIDINTLEKYFRDNHPNQISRGIGISFQDFKKKIKLISDTINKLT